MGCKQGKFYDQCSMVSPISVAGATDTSDSTHQSRSSQSTDRDEYISDHFDFLTRGVTLA